MHNSSDLAIETLIAWGVDTVFGLPGDGVVIKNNTLGQIKWEQMMFLGNPEFECAL